MKIKKICIVTGSRAEYGLLYWLMKSIDSNPNLELQIIVTGMHLSVDFGLTYKEIEKDGFIINKKIETVLSSDTSSAVSKSTGIGLISFADAYNELNPDIVLILGDRFEILPAAISATFSNILLGHIHGGETTEGAFDESIRHSITKMSWLHFVATNEYKKRVIQLGENPKRVFNVGGLGVDSIKKTSLLSMNELTKVTNIHFKEKNLLVTFHPVTLEKNNSQKSLMALLRALENFDDIGIIFTMPNADPGGSFVKKLIHEFAFNYKERVIVFNSMGRLNYLSALQFVDGVVGNSSSGLIEAPTFKIGTINIGDRQTGRIKAKSVIDCAPSESSIIEAINLLYSKKFQKKLSLIENPYGNGNSADKILKVLTNIKIPKNLKKVFYDL
tara:strand:+ start:36436 stop:37596 length:1161 start_codon:yes stop_codon:yes gene_type:complete